MVQYHKYFILIRLDQKLLTPNFQILIPYSFRDTLMNNHPIYDCYVLGSYLMKLSLPFKCSDLASTKLINILFLRYVK